MILDWYYQGIFFRKIFPILINFGGDMYGRGDWRVGLESPFAADEVIGLIHLLDDFLACSAGTKRKWKPSSPDRSAYRRLCHRGGGNLYRVKKWDFGGFYATALSVMPWNTACEVFRKTPKSLGYRIKRGKYFSKEEVERKCSSN